MLDAIIQEIDLATRSVVFEWHAAQHIDISESYESYSRKYPYDPVHINSIEPTIGGDILVSARNTWTVYRTGTADGVLRWRLGGKHSDFTLGPGARFAWQHDARSHPSNVLTLFDDEGDPPEARQSRALVLTVDEASRTVAVVRQYHHPSNPLLAGGQGSLQVLPNHNLLVGWGAEPSYTECRPDGAVVVDAKFAKGASYRAFRFPWVGVPDDRPALAVDRTRSGNVTGHASWNGATEVASWNLLAGSTAQAPTTLSSAPRNGFEMTIETRTRDRRFSVQAIDDHGKVLGTSLALTV